MKSDVHLLYLIGNLVLEYGLSILGEINTNHADSDLYMQVYAGLSKHNLSVIYTKILNCFASSPLDRHYWILALKQKMQWFCCGSAYAGILIGQKIGS